MSTGQVSTGLMLISDKLAATASRIRHIAASGNLSERQKAVAAIHLIAAIPSEAQLGNIVSAACYEELARVVIKNED